MAVILLADESPADRALARKTLIAAGHQVLEAQTATEALWALTQDDIDVIVVDTGLPDAPGDRIIDRIREVPPHLLTPIVATVGLEPTGPQKRRRWPRPRSHEEPSRSPLAGVAVERLPKPFAPHELVEAVTRALRLRAELGQAHGDLERRALEFDDWARLQNEAREES